MAFCIYCKSCSYSIIIIIIIKFPAYDLCKLYVYVDAENSYFYVNHVGITNDVLFCALESYAAENLSCVIQAIFKLNQGNCSSYHLENSNYANQNLISMSSTNVSIVHLPRNQLFCFVVEGKNSTSTVVVTGTFRTHTMSGCGVN